MPQDWTLLAGLEPGDLQSALLADANAIMDGQPGPEQDRLLPALTEAAVSYERASAEWPARRSEMDAAGEFAVVKPYKGLSNADELDRLTDQY